MLGFFCATIATAVHAAVHAADQLLRQVPPNMCSLPHGWSQTQPASGVLCTTQLAKHPSIGLHKSSLAPKLQDPKIQVQAQVLPDHAQPLSAATQTFLDELIASKNYPIHMAL